MPFRHRTPPPFTFTSSSRRDSFSLPDYYRSTRLEHYGPYYRSSEPVQDLMRTIDLRGRESPHSIGALSIISEEGEIELDDMAFEVIAKLEHLDDSTEHPHKHEKKEKWPGWLWRLFLLVLHKDRGRRADAVKKAAPNVRFDLSE